MVESVKPRGFVLRGHASLRSCLLRDQALKRRFYIGLAHCCRPDPADDDGVSTDRVNDFPASEVLERKFVWPNQVAAATAPQTN
jgi:hypothetical protein